MNAADTNGRRFVLGVDGGGTHTRALLVRDDGVVVGGGVSGASNIQSAGLDAARQAVGDAVDAAWQNAGSAERAADAAFLGVAGVVSEADRVAVASLAQSLHLARVVNADHDIRTALAGGLPGREGIALIAGTGSSCYGRRMDGRSWRSGGWGHVLDDCGSAYWLAVRALAALTRDTDGRGAATVLTPTLLEALGMIDANDLLTTAGSVMDKPRIAALAPGVLGVAAAGDPVATAIALDGATELAAMTAAVATHLDMGTSPEVMITGGLTKNRYYTALVHDAILRRCAGARIREPLLQPVCGAALLALESLAIPITSELVTTMRKSYADAQTP